MRAMACASTAWRTDDGFSELAQLFAVDGVEAHVQFFALRCGGLLIGHSTSNDPGSITGQGAPREASFDSGA
jgi:hypothetical protein